MSSNDGNSSVKTIPYPSIDELMPEELLAKIPATLARDIKERYDTLGEKYLTINTQEDGRLINGMMYTNRVENCIEEIIDAVFCMLGWIFKARAMDLVPNDSAYFAMTGLIEVYSLLMQERDDIAA